MAFFIGIELALLLIVASIFEKLFIHHADPKPATLLVCSCSLLLSQKRR